MKKDIYIITNDINDKVYIGQAKNTSSRWSRHKSAAKCHGGFIKVDKAMAQIGIEHFTCEIIEHQIENYDDMERYWIKYYDCRYPKGYNVEEGGEGAKAGVENSCAIIKDQRIVDAIVEELLTSDKKLREIADEFDLTMKLISAINRGVSYHKADISYPIRKRGADLVDEIDIDSLYDDLMYTKKSKLTLAEEYGISIYILNQINKGEKYRREDYEYPLRKSMLIEQEVQSIKDMIKNTSLSLREIARQCNTSYTTVAHINSGKYHHDKNIKYPIR